MISDLLARLGIPKKVAMAASGALLELFAAYLRSKGIDAPEYVFAGLFGASIAGHTYTDAKATEAGIAK